MCGLAGGALLHKAGSRMFTSSFLFGQILSLRSDTIVVVE